MVAQCGENRLLGQDGGKDCEVLPIHNTAFCKHVNGSIESEPCPVIVSENI